MGVCHDIGAGRLENAVRWLIIQGSILTTCIDHQLGTRHWSIFSIGSVPPLDPNSQGLSVGPYALENPLLQPPPSPSGKGNMSTQVPSPNGTMLLSLGTWNSPPWWPEHSSSNGAASPRSIIQSLVSISGMSVPRSKGQARGNCFQIKGRRLDFGQSLVVLS